MAALVFTHHHRVTYAECTIGNHIYYSRYLDLLEAARGEFFRRLGLTFDALHQDDFLFPVTEAHLRYLAAARYDDVLRIDVWLTQLDRVRLGFGYRLLRGEALLVEASTRHACTSAADKPKRLPAQLSEKLQPYLRTSD